MAQTGPWRVKGVDRKTRRLARDAAARSGMSTGAWIDRTIKSEAGVVPREDAEPLVTEFLRSARGAEKPKPAAFPPEKPRLKNISPERPRISAALAASATKPGFRAGRGVIGGTIGILLLVGGYLLVTQYSQDVAVMFAGIDKLGTGTETGIASKTPGQTSAGIGSGPTTVAQKLAANAASGDAQAQHDLGLMYVQGNGVPKDTQKGATLLEQSAGTGLPNAQYRMGILYEKGIGVTQNLETAFLWYQRAAMQGHIRAQHNLGRFYAEGKGTERNYAEAMRWFSSASQGGLAESHYSLGMIHEHGLGVAKDDRKAAAFYRSALTAGSAEAASKLAKLGPGQKEASDKTKETLAANAGLTNDTPSTTTANGRTLSPKGISDLQKLLARLDLTPGPPDGVLGDQTVEAIKLYQRFAGLPVDGKPSVELLRDLRQVVGAMDTNAINTPSAATRP